MTLEFDAPLPKQAAAISGENGQAYASFAPGRWISAPLIQGYESFILPHMQKHRQIPPDTDFSVAIHDESAYFITISHRKVRIGLLMPEWTHWEECLCEWLNVLVDSHGWGAVCFETEGIDAVICAVPDTSHLSKNPKADYRYINLLVWADGSWHPNTSGRDHKKRAIHITIERYKLVTLFYAVLQYVLQQKNGVLPQTPWQRLPFDLSRVEEYLRNSAPKGDCSMADR